MVLNAERKSYVIKELIKIRCCYAHDHNDAMIGKRHCNNYHFSLTISFFSPQPAVDKISVSQSSAINS